jgi:hypothetical protein
MRYMMLYKPGYEDIPPTEEHMAAMGRLIEDMAKAGVLIATDGLQSSSKGARVRRFGGKTTVIDGPFAIVEAKSKEHAIELAKRFLEVVGEGESEVRLMHGEPAYDANAA